MNNSWEVFNYIFVLSIFLLTASVIRYFINKVSDKVIIPTSIIAGFIGLLLGSEFLNVFPLDQDILGKIVYHLMAIGFIAMSLKKRSKRQSAHMVKSSMFIVSGYLIQGIVGLGIILILILFINPNLFVGLGLLLPLGFGQGPGQAYSIGSQWESLGFTGGGNIGLSIATIGFVWATIIGLPWMNYLIKKNKNPSIATDNTTRLVKSSKELTNSDSMDTMTVQILLIGIAYGLTFFTLKILTGSLSGLGTFGVTFSSLLWGFHFNIGAAYGLLIRTIINQLNQRQIITIDMSDSLVLQRISGTAFDFMITASISAISLISLQNYIIPIILITTAGGLATLLYSNYLLSRTLEFNKLENIIAFYGMQTGTISTGMALLKGVDPNFQTDAAENLVFGSAFAMVLGLPLMVLINLPIIGYVNQQPIYYFITLFLFISYLIVLLYYQLRSKDKKTMPFTFKKTG